MAAKKKQVTTEAKTAKPVKTKKVEEAPSSTPAKTSSVCLPSCI